MKSINVKTIKVTIVSHFRGILVLAAEISFLQIIVIILKYHKNLKVRTDRSEQTVQTHIRLLPKDPYQTAP